MTDKLVTHADANTIEDARRWISNVPVGQKAVSGKARVLDLLDRLRVAAEADQPPLPEGWVLLEGEDGGLYPYWHMADRLYGGKGGDAYRIEATATRLRDRLTPLRPTVTESQIKAAAEDCLCEPSTIRQHLAAVGIEVAK